MLIFSINFVFINAQNSNLDFGKLWQGKFEPERLEMIRSMNDGEHYTVIEQDKNSKKIVSYSYEKVKEKNIVFDSNDFSEILDISDYSNIQVISLFSSNVDSNSIPHNLIINEIGLRYININLHNCGLK